MAASGEFYYKLLKPVAKVIFYTLFNVKEGDYVLPEKGQAFILVGHHVSAFDPIIVNTFSKRLIRFLYADANDDLKYRSKAMQLVDMIPFSKNSADFKSIRQIKSRIDEGLAIGIYPEGGASWDGKTDALIYSTSKLIKMMKVPVYGVSYNGAYLSKPRWCDHSRKGSVLMNTYEIFTQEEIKNLNVEQVHDKLVKALDYNEFEWQEEAKIAFKGKKLAESIEKLLYWCPECKSFNSIISKGNHFRCRTCKSTFTYNKFGQIHIKRANNKELYSYQIPEWNELQRKTYKGFILSKDTSSLTKEFYHGVEVSESNRAIPFEGIKVFKNKALINIPFLFDGRNLINIEGKVFIPLEKVKNQSITFNSRIEFNYNKEEYRIEFENKTSLSIKLLYDTINFLKED